MSLVAEGLIGKAPKELFANATKFDDAIKNFSKPIIMVMSPGERVIVGRKNKIAVKRYPHRKKFKVPRGSQSYVLGRDFGENGGMLNCFVWWLKTVGGNDIFYRDFERSISTLGKFGVPWERGFVRNQSIGKLTRANACTIDSTNHRDYPLWERTTPPGDTEVRKVTCLSGNVMAIVLDQGEPHSILRKGDCEGIFFPFIIGDAAMEKHVQCHLNQYAKYLNKWRKDPTVSHQIIFKLVVWSIYLCFTTPFIGQDNDLETHSRGGWGYKRRTFDYVYEHGVWTSTSYIFVWEKG